MEINPAQRISHIKPYFFSILDQKITKLMERGVDVIRLDMGSPDLAPASFIVDALIESVRRPDKHRYTPSGGSPSFLKSIAEYYQNRFNTELNPKSEILALIGSKEGIFNIHHTLLNPGDLVLLPDPCYAVYRSGIEISNCRFFTMPLLKENKFLPDLEKIPDDIAHSAKMMWLNYPNNPTGAVADLEFFERCVKFAKKHNVIIAHDAPYVDVTFDGYVAPSILQVEGAKDCVVEFNSLSKTYNMAGWRIGMVVGNSEVIRLLKTYKSQIDSSLFAPIMDAGEAALTGDQGWIKERNLIYQERRDIVVETLSLAGFDLEQPKAGLYVWAKLPPGCGDTWDFCAKLLEETGVSITPGGFFGHSCEDYVRISNVIPTGRIKEATDRMLEWITANFRK